MSYSRSLDPRLRRRLTTRIASGIRSLGPGEHPVFNLTEVSGEVYLPEVHLFSDAAASWMLPSMKSDVETLIYAYEVFAEQELGTTPNPGKVIEEVFKSAEVPGMTQVFDLGRDPLQWFTPAVRLVAYAGTFKDSTVDFDFETQTYSAYVGGAHFEVSPKGVFSNAQCVVIPATAAPTDTATAAMRLPSEVSSSKIIVALDQMLTSPTRDYGAHLRVLSALFETRLLNPTQFLAALVKTEPVEDDGSAAIRRQAAAEQALRVLQHIERDVVRNLYSAVVPSLYSSREFVRTFGSTASTNGARKIRPRTRTEWAEQIRARVAQPV